MIAATPRATEAAPAAAEAPPPPKRLGSPVEPRRILHAIRRARKLLSGVTAVAAILGAVAGKTAPKTYAAAATILWEPPTGVRADPVRELATLSQSVKLPANLLHVRERTGGGQPLESLDKAIEVKLGENSMLLTVTARGKTAHAAADLAQATVDVFMDAQRERARTRLREVVTALRQSLSQAEAAHVESRDQYDAFRAENGVDDFPTEIQTAIQDVARLRLAVKDAQVELQGVEARQGALRESHAKNPESVVISRSELNSDDARVGQLETELAEARARFAGDHPRVQVIEAELTSLREHARASAPVVSGQIVGRNAIRDSLTAQIEESSALRSAIAVRAGALATLQQQAESRAAQLSGVQGQAAKLLADVKANEDHVALLLKQLAMAEDDIRSASSGFQTLSSATPPEHSEKSVGRVLAVVIPVIALLLTAIVVLVRELGKVRITTGGEAAYFAKAPVLWSTSWPAKDPVEPDGEASALARALADACEDCPGVIGVAALGEPSTAGDLGALLVDRLRRRGRRAVVFDATQPRGAAGATAADVLEGRAFGARLAALARKHEHVVALLPPASDLAALRAAGRWLDGVLLVVESGLSGKEELYDVTQAVSKGKGVAIAVVNVPRDLLPLGHRGLGDPQALFRDTKTLRASLPGLSPRVSRAAAPPPAPAGATSRAAGAHPRAEAAPRGSGLAEGASAARGDAKAVAASIALGADKQATSPRRSRAPRASRASVTPAAATASEPVHRVQEPGT
jgi:uncharacterized protein involved in exopolysaccharide biosynthesis